MKDYLEYLKYNSRQMLAVKRAERANQKWEHVGHVNSKDGNVYLIEAVVYDPKKEKGK